LFKSILLLFNCLVLFICSNIIRKGWHFGSMGVQRYFQQYVSYTVTASFIGGWNWSNLETPPSATHKLYDIILYWSHVASGRNRM